MWTSGPRQTKGFVRCEGVRQKTGLGSVYSDQPLDAWPKKGLVLACLGMELRAQQDSFLGLKHHKMRLLLGLALGKM